VNIAAGAMMTAVQISTVILTPPAGYYVFCSIIEITCTVLVVSYGWRWREAAAQANVETPALR
jgi:hypothetical protein